MGRPDLADRRKFEHLAKVNAQGVVVAMVELAEGSGWESWTDSEGNRYVYLTDLIPDRRNASLDVHGLKLLPPQPVTITAVTHRHALALKKQAATALGPARGTGRGRPRAGRRRS